MAKAKRHRPDYWATASRIIGLLAKLAGLADTIRRALGK